MDIAALIGERVVYSRGGVETPLRAVVIFGNAISPSAGAPIYRETGDRVSVVIPITAFDSVIAAPPALGDVVRLGDGRSAYVKLVTRGADEYTLRCVINPRGGGK